MNHKVIVCTDHCIIEYKQSVVCNANYYNSC